jgi:hypothetical protein
VFGFVKSGIARRQGFAMKMTGITAVLAICVSACGLGQATQPATGLVKVPDSATAVSIAEKALAKIYGKRQIESERPFKASLSNGVWHVGGTLYCKDRHGNVVTGRCVGGVAMADIRQSDGHVLRTSHGK